MVSLGWSSATLDVKYAVIPILNTLTTLYLIAVTISTLNDDVPHIHFTQVVHIAAITAIATLVFGSIVILPSSQVTTSVEAVDGVSWGLRYAAVALYASACVISLNIPRGPALYFPPEQIYSEKTVASITSRYRDNVCGIVNDSIFGMLFFSYTTKVLSYMTKYNQCRSPSQSRSLCSAIPQKVSKLATYRLSRSTCVRPICSGR